MKKSAVCQTTPLKKAADGNLSTTMTVRSDDGLCDLKVSKDSGKAYTSFGVSPSPEHGKAFLYNLDNDTHVTYTPTMGYAGQDTFTAILVPAPGEKRVRLTVTAQVDATGVVLPKAQAPVESKTEATKTTGSKGKKAVTRRRVVSHKK